MSAKLPEISMTDIEGEADFEPSTFDSDESAIVQGDLGSSNQSIPKEESLGQSDKNIVKTELYDTPSKNELASASYQGITPLPSISEGVSEESDISVENQPASTAEGAQVVDINAVRARIEQLTQQFESPVRSGMPQPVGLGFDPPEHFDANDLLKAANKPINWQVEQLWTQRAKILLASEPKAGKTFFVCSIAVAMASGRMLWDKLVVKEPGPVGILAAEDDEGEIGRRLQRMCRSMGILLGDLPIHWWPGERIRLNRVRDIDWIRQQIRNYGLKLMIYDPMARLMDGDENSKECVSGVLTPASEITRRDDCSVMIVHHLGKDDPERPKTLGQRIRGSSDIRSWYTTAIFLTGKLGNGRVGVELEQRTSGRIPQDFVIRAQEKEEESVYGLGTIRLVASLDAKLRGNGEGTNQQLIDTAADRIMGLADAKGSLGLTTSEIIVNLGLGRTVMNAALKKLIREERVLAFEEAKDIPDKQVLVPLGTPAERSLARQASGDRIVPPPSMPPPARKPEPAMQSEMFELGDEEEEKARALKPIERSDAAELSSRQEASTEEPAAGRPGEDPDVVAAMAPSDEDFMT